MILITNSAYKIFSTVEAAEKMAADLISDDGDGTIYEVRPDPLGSGRALIAIVDPDEGFLGYL